MTSLARVLFDVADGALEVKRQSLCQAAGTPSKDRLVRLTPFGPWSSCRDPRPSPDSRSHACGSALAMGASGPDASMTKTEAIADVVMAGGAPSVECKLPSMPLFSGKSRPR